MALIHSPNIVTNGLVLALDGANVRSFRGEPTTNLVPDGGLVGMSGIALSYLGIEDGWKKYSMSGTFTGGTYPYIMHVTSTSFTGDTTYTTRCTIKTNSLSKFNYFGTGMNYVNVPMNSSGTSYSVTNIDGSFTVGRTAFVYTNTTNQPGYILSNPINNTTFNSSTDFVWIKDLQIEQKAYATPYVAGTRGTTVATGGGWADLSGNGNHGELLNGPTFNSDNGGSIVFDGTNDYVELNTNNIITGTNPFSFECWYTITAVNGGGQVFGNYGSGYTSNYLWISGEYGIYINGAVYFPGYPLTSGTIHMVATRASNGATVLYRDGVQVNSGTLNGSIPAVPNFRIGADTTSAGGVGAERLNGKIYIQRVYNRVLSATEVQQNYNATRARFGV